VPDVPDVILRATAEGWDSQEFPGWLRVVVEDASGQVHVITEKASVLTGSTIAPSATFPFELWLRGAHEGMDGEAVLVRLAHGVETTNGLRELAVSHQDVRRS
jgi:hypothetical protein